jgi:hypothetical protein
MIGRRTTIIVIAFLSGQRERFGQGFNYVVRGPGPPPHPCGGRTAGRSDAVNRLRAGRRTATASNGVQIYHFVCFPSKSPLPKRSRAAATVHRIIHTNAHVTRDTHHTRTYTPVVLLPLKNIEIDLSSPRSVIGLRPNRRPTAPVIIPVFVTKQHNSYADVITDVRTVGPLSDRINARSRHVCPLETIVSRPTVYGRVRFRVGHEGARISESIDSDAPRDFRPIEFWFRVPGRHS